MSMTLALLFATIAAAPDCRLADARVERYVAAVATARAGHEYCEFRRYDRLGDLDGDGADDLVMTFTIEGVEGSNNGTEAYLVAFLSSAKAIDAAPRLLIGERGGRMPDGVSVQGREIVVSTVEYAESDPMCCPSRRGEARFALRAGKLVEK